MRNHSTPSEQRDILEEVRDENSKLTLSIVRKVFGTIRGSSVYRYRLPNKWDLGVSVFSCVASIVDVRSGARVSSGSYVPRRSRDQSQRRVKTSGLRRASRTPMTIVVRKFARVGLQLKIYYHEKNLLNYVVNYFFISLILIE